MRSRRVGQGHRGGSATAPIAPRHGRRARQHLQHLLRGAGVFLAGGSMMVTSCGSPRSAASPTRTTSTEVAPTVTRTPPSLPNSTVAVQSGYGGKEDFCAQPPLSGRMSYDGTSGTARPTITIGELPPNSQVAVNW